MKELRSFLKVKRDCVVLMPLGRSFHHQGSLTVKIQEGNLVPLFSDTMKHSSCTDCRFTEATCISRTLEIQ